MSGIARSMCGNGFVWLIQGPNKQLYVTATYNAGTPYDYARSMSFDLNSPVSGGVAEEVERRESLLQQDQRRPEWPLPLLCVNVFEHAYLTDYGFAGKEEYFEQWWKAVDWFKVEERFDPLGAFQRASEGRATL